MTACAKLAVEEDSGETSTRKVIAYPGLLLAIYKLLINRQHPDAIADPYSFRSRGRYNTK
jgi:hypothetical protein